MSHHMTIAEALEQAGRKLEERYGNGPIPVTELRQEAARLGGHQEESILPSDFCYNRTNLGISPAVKPLFIQEGRGHYRYVGANHPYSGPVFHKAKGQAERQVGDRNLDR